MARKRIATSSLNHDNWNEDEELEDPGKFQAASLVELQSRPMKSARRRRQLHQQHPYASNTNPSSESHGQSTNIPCKPSIFSTLSNLANPGIQDHTGTFFSHIPPPDDSNLQFFKAIKSNDMKTENSVFGLLGSHNDPYNEPSTSTQRPTILGSFVDMTGPGVHGTKKPYLKSVLAEKHTPIEENQYSESPKDTHFGFMNIESKRHDHFGPRGSSINRRSSVLSTLGTLASAGSSARGSGTSKKKSFIQVNPGSEKYLGRDRILEPYPETSDSGYSGRIRPNPFNTSTVNKDMKAATKSDGESFFNMVNPRGGQSLGQDKFINTFVPEKESMFDFRSSKHDMFKIHGSNFTQCPASEGSSFSQFASPRPNLENPFSFKKAREIPPEQGLFHTQVRDADNSEASSSWCAGNELRMPLIPSGPTSAFSAGIKTMAAKKAFFECPEFSPDPSDFNSGVLQFSAFKESPRPLSDSPGSSSGPLNLSAKTHSPSAVDPNWPTYHSSNFPAAIAGKRSGKPILTPISKELSAKFADAAFFSLAGSEVPLSEERATARRLSHDPNNMPNWMKALVPIDDPNIFARMPPLGKLLYSPTVTRGSLHKTLGDLSAPKPLLRVDWESKESEGFRGINQSFGTGVNQSFGTGVNQSFGTGVNQSFGTGVNQSFGTGVNQFFSSPCPPFKGDWVAPKLSNFYTPSNIISTSTEDSGNAIIAADVLKERDSRSLLKAVPTEIMAKLDAKSHATGKSLKFLERTYQLNETTLDWLQILIREDLTINIAEVIPSYIEELMNLVIEERDNQESEEVKADLAPTQAVLKKMLDAFQMCGANSQETSGPLHSMQTSTMNVPLLPTKESKVPNSFSNIIKDTQDSLIQVPTAPKEVVPPTEKYPSITTEEETSQSEDEPPKVTFTPVIEEGFTFSRRCKVFIKKSDPNDPDDTSYQEKGLGTLFVKPVKSGKAQLIVRGETSLGSILINASITAETPIQRANKNTVMIVCIPTTNESIPRTVLIRVKAPEDAQELMESLIII